MSNHPSLVQIGSAIHGKAVATSTGRRMSTNTQRSKLYIHTFGCQMNVYDSEKLALLLGEEYQEVLDAEEADLVLINTCSIREKAEHKLYSLVGSFRDLKKKNPRLIIGVGGCVAQQEGGKILKRAPLTDFVFGTHNLSLVPSLVEGIKNGRGKQVAVDYREDWEELPLGGGKGRATAFVTISRGCNKNCTYCIVPTTRGPEVSRPIDEVLREVTLAASRGVKEITLLGQTVNSYGLDLTPRVRFSELLEQVAEVDGIERIRFTSPHPQEIRSDFYSIIRSNPKVCHHVHMPLQSGSDKILKAMNRNYRMKKYYQIIDGLRDACPDVAISTDLIVGFPGETDEDFQATLEAMEQVQFDSSYSFVFSPRPGTTAESLPEQIEPAIKNKRLQQLQALQNRHTDRRLHDWVGKQTEILVDGFVKSNNRLVQGRNSQNILIHLENEHADIGPGMLVDCTVTRAARYTLHATRGVGNNEQVHDLHG